MGYLYEFVAGFRNNERSNIFMKRWSKFWPIFIFDFSVFPMVFRMV